MLARHPFLKALTRVRHWWRERHKRLSDLLRVEFDDLEVRVKVIERLDPQWNQAFRWSDIKRVCFKDGGMLSSDIIFVSLINPDRVVVVLTEANGGPQFCGALCERGYFPEQVWRRAIAETGGGMHCWPPGDEGKPASRP